MRRSIKTANRIGGLDAWIMVAPTVIATLLIVVATPPETWFRIAEALLGSEKVIVSPTPSAPPGPVPSEKLPQPNTVAAVEAEMVSVPVVPLPRAG